MHSGEVTLRTGDRHAPWSLLLLSFLAPAAFAEDEAAPAVDPARQAEYARNTPKAITQIQRFRAESSADVVRDDARKGVARLLDVAPEVGRAYVLTFKWEGRAAQSWHLEARGANHLVLDGGDLAVAQPGSESEARFSTRSSGVWGWSATPRAYRAH